MSAHFSTGLHAQFSTGADSVGAWDLGLADLWPRPAEESAPVRRRAIALRAMWMKYDWLTLFSERISGAPHWRGKSVHFLHSGHNRCGTALVSAATSALLTVSWEPPTPAGLQTLAFGLRFVRRTVEADAPLTAALDSARNYTLRAADSWYAARNNDAELAAWEGRIAFDELCDILQLCECTCDRPDEGYAAFAAVVSDTVGAITRYISNSVENRADAGTPAVMRTNLRMTVEHLVRVIDKFGAY